MQNILEVKNLSKQYGQQYALRDVSLSIQKGEIYGLIGKNGTGKTTLIKVITQLIHASSGSVSVFGSQTSKEWTEALRKTGSVIETPVAYNQMTAYENLSYCCKVHQIAQPDQLIKETLAYVGLTDTGKKKFRNFSLGMKQRLGIAIALIHKPELMILDEPINGLDPLGIKEFRNMIQRLNQELGITFIISSHILSELYLVASKFGIIDQGQLVTEFTKEDFDQASEDYIVLKASEPEQAASLIQEKLHYQLKDADKAGELHIMAQEQELNAIVRELVLANISISGIYAAHKDLEKYFTDLVQ
ncbi:putative ABC transporter, ATP-binding protein [Streptococcus sp. DD11]|uniref:ATP-binding cassette domain-containing protein n=1 Tax=Streptococcus sp. DD11 TaxID=1777879 RepID=UPI000793ADD2|nr:ATP-binding cassette domain-containing protein [Streptococcus sp. DD11]KXT82951.1 putative ABC transporter, ATP-binding protein [Streptococcus sp. DD11]